MSGKTSGRPTADETLWTAIRNRTAAISFARYQQFVDRLLQINERGRLEQNLETNPRERGTHLRDRGAYDALKVATDAILLLEGTSRMEHDSLPARSSQQGIDDASAGEPAARDSSICFIELIWSYWHEEGGLVQAMNAITQRFQDSRQSDNNDPLAHLEIDPLRPLNNLLWGFVQDETQRLSAKRREYEYEHQYGLSLSGKAARDVQPADHASKFPGAFHHLLRSCSLFFKNDDDTTVIADESTLLVPLKEARLSLTQGGHNQFGDLPSTARAEVMQQQWILAQSEIRDFLQSRETLPCGDDWMPQVDTMNRLQSWSETPVAHFRDLAVYGEQLLLSIRYGDWIESNDQSAAKNWARYWKPEIQGYLHAYLAARGIDLSNP